MSTPAARKQPNPWYVAVISGMASYIDSAAIVSSGIALVLYQDALGLTPDQIGVLSAVLTLGIAIGALIGGRLGDRFGRRPVFVATMSLVVLGAALAVFAGGFVPLFIGMALIGFSTGADLPVSIANIAEVASDENRGKLVGFSQVLWVVGIMVTIAVSTLVGGMGQLGGQIMFAHVGIVALIVLILRFTIPESPVWLTARHERATGVHTERAERARLRDLLRAPFVAPFVALMLFYSLVNLAANTGGQFGTYLWVNGAGSTVQFSSTFQLILLPVALLLNLLFLRFVDTRFRMLFFYIGAAAYMLTLVIPIVFGISVPTLILWQIGGAVGGAFAFEAIMKIWSQESFPTLLRSTAQGTIIAVARVLAAALALVTPRLIESGPQTLFIVLSVVMAIGLTAAVVVFRRRTRNEFDVEDEIVPVTVG